MNYVSLWHLDSKQTALDGVIMEEALKQWHFAVHISTPKSEDNLYFTR